MCSYKSPKLFDERYARNPNRNGEDPLRGIDERYDVAGYLDHQGEKFVSRFRKRWMRLNWDAAMRRKPRRCSESRLMYRWWGFRRTGYFPRKTFARWQ